MAKKRPPSTHELNMMIERLKPGEIKHFPQHDMIISKPLHELPTGMNIDSNRPRNAKVIGPKNKK